MHLDRAIFQARQASQGHIGRLAVGMTAVIANSILPNVVQAFQQAFPHVVLELREVTVEQQIQMLRTHQIDVMFQQSEKFEQFEHSDPDLIFQPILQEYFILVLPETHPLAKQSQVALEALKDEPIILPSFDVFPFYEKVIQLCRNIGFEPNIVQTVTVSGAVTLLSLVAAGIGLSILPNHVQTLQRTGVVYRPIQNAGLTRQIAVVWRQDDTSVVLSNFLKIIQDLIGLSFLNA